MVSPGTNRRVVGPDRALRSDIRFRFTRDRHLIGAVGCRYRWWLTLAHSKASCMAAVSSANGEVHVGRFGKVTARHNKFLGSSDSDPLVCNVNCPAG